MTKVEMLDEIGILECIRERLGANNGNKSKRFDPQINLMSNTDLIATYCAWELGSGGWWFDLKGKFDRLEELSKEKP